MVRLGVLHLRLTRWGEAVGLNKPIVNGKAPSTKTLKPEEALATKLLKQIKERFEDAVKAVQDIEIVEDVTASTADLGDKTLVEGLRNISIKRHPRTSVMTKAKWVIYQKDSLSSLINDLSTLVDQLVDVSAADADILTRICDGETSQLFDDERLHQASVAMLEDVAVKLDGKLADAIARHKARVSDSSLRSFT